MISKAKINSKNYQKGFSIVETVVAISILSLGLLSLSSFIIFSIRAANKIKDRAYANHLAVEAMEAVRSFRNNTYWDSDGISSLTTGSGSPYHPVISISSASSSWQLYSGVEDIDGYEREVVFDTVSRDVLDDSIESVYSVLNDDPDTRKVTVSVSKNNTNITIVSYITSWLR